MPFFFSVNDDMRPLMKKLETKSLKRESNGVNKPQDRRKGRRREETLK